MRVYGRVAGSTQWTVVETQPNGSNDLVNITWLCQVLKLNLNESPWYADWGIPQLATIETQIYPDFYVARIQQRFVQYFAALVISKVPNTNAPVYNVQLTTNSGTPISFQVAQ